MTEPAASVLMPVFNEEPALLEKAVESVLSQTFRDFEFVIVDDGSTRGDTLDMLDRFAAQDSRIRLFKEERRGVYKARNFGLTQCRGEFVFKHDSDDWSEPHRFEKQIAFLQAHPEVAIVGSHTLTHQEDGRSLWVWRYPESASDIAAAFPVQMAFGCGAVCFRLSEMRAIGGFREDFPYSMDYDCYWRLSDRAGGANIPEVLYHYRFGLKAISTSKSFEQDRCGAIVRELGAMRRSGQPEIVEEAVRRADLGMKEKPIETEMLQHADRTMLSGGHAAALKLYLKCMRMKPLSTKVWLKVFRWMVFVAAPPLRQAIFQPGFRGRRP
jgi:glycosyltransferase involved in cell wall biosynthesis